MPHEHHREPVLHRPERQRPEVCRRNGFFRHRGRHPRRAGQPEIRLLYPFDDPETVLLIDSWADQSAIDVHHASPMMQTIAALRSKYGLHMRVERYVSDEGGVPEKDQKFIRK